LDITNKTALVTGGASGLGLATVRRFVDAGGSAVIADLSSSDGELIAKELGDRVRFVPTDVTDEAEVQAAVDAASELGGLHVVVNCAGIAAGSAWLGRRVPILWPISEGSSKLI
jgi:NAD(P)-dependent dehydrogenase (short-subunit alcohol dehydrogenase family)